MSNPYVSFVIIDKCLSALVEQVQIATDEKTPKTCNCIAHQKISVYKTTTNPWGLQLKQRIRRKVKRHLGTTFAQGEYEGETIPKITSEDGLEYLPDSNPWPSFVLCHNKVQTQVMYQGEINSSHKVPVFLLSTTGIQSQSFYQWDT